MTADRKPFWAKCGSCSHCWAAAYMPSDALLFGKLIKRAACPMCGETKKVGIAKQDNGTLLENSPALLPGAISDASVRLVSWFSSGDVGISSKALATHMSGGTVRDGWGWGHPSDPDDLGRCLRLLELFPEWKPRMPEMATRGPGWAGLAARWEEIAKSMADEVGIAWEKGRSAPLTYDLMKTAIGDGYRADKNLECTFDEKGYLRSAQTKKVRSKSA